MKFTEVLNQFLNNLFYELQLSVKCFYSQITQDQVTVFTADLTQLQEKFIECGPSSVGNDLDQGL